MPANLRDQVLAAVHALPAGAAMQDIRYQLHVIESVNRGRTEITAGKGIPHAKAAELLRKKWRIA